MKPEEDIPKRVEAALLYRLKTKAWAECDDLAKVFAQCATGRVFSVAWKCQQEKNELSACLATHTSRLEELKQKWIKKGRRQQMSEKDWEELLDGF